MFFFALDIHKSAQPDVHKAALSWTDEGMVFRVLLKTARVINGDEPEAISCHLSTLPDGGGRS